MFSLDLGVLNITRSYEGKYYNRFFIFFFLRLCFSWALDVCSGRLRIGGEKINGNHNLELTGV